MPALFPSWWELPTSEDVITIGRQIGRPARGVRAIAVRCRFGKPAVAVVAPILPPSRRPAFGREGGELPLEPFPTTFWLTCPYLVAQVSRLESEGWIARIARRVEEDGTLRERLHRAHRTAAEVRALLVEGYALRRLTAASERAARRILEGGIAGMRYPLGIKCLHAHLADHLARSGNPVGQLVCRLLAERGAWLAGHEGCRCEEQPGEAPAGTRTGLVARCGA